MQASSYSPGFPVDQEGVGGKIPQPVRENIVIFQPVNSMGIAGFVQGRGLFSKLKGPFHIRAG